MNRVLFKAAAIVNIAAAALIYVACSGDDGKDGPPGPAGANCTVAESTTVPGGVDVICGSDRKTLSPGPAGAQGAPGQNGQGVPADGCYLAQTSAGFDAICGGQNMGPVITGAGGGCSINPGDLGDPYYIFTCPGGATYQVAKAICGANAYDPNRYTCDFSDPSDPKLSTSKCGTKVISDTLTQFCQNPATGTVKFFCGRQAVVDSILNAAPQTDLSKVTGKPYTATQFCQVSATDAGNGLAAIVTAGGANLTTDTVKTANQAAVGTIKSLCGTEGLVYGPYQFCYENGGINKKCSTTDIPGTISAATVSDLVTIAGGPEYGANEMCVSGKVSGSCGGLPYDVATKFCQGSTTIKLLCSRDDVVDSASKAGVSDATILNNLRGKQYPATQFCQDKAATAVSAAADVSTPTNGDPAPAPTNNEGKSVGGKIKPYCNMMVGSPAVSTPRAFGTAQFCQGAGTAAAEIKYLCGDNKGANVADISKRKEYTATQFCQAQTGTFVSADASGSFALNTASDAASGTIQSYCIQGSTKSAFGLTQYCNIQSQVQPTLYCGTQPSGGSDGLPAGCMKQSDYDAAESACASDNDCIAALGDRCTTDPVTGTAGTKPYNPETHFCINAGASGIAYPTCKPRRRADQNDPTATNSDLYDPDSSVCETRGNILYKYLVFAGWDAASTPNATTKKWILENAQPNNVSTFTWTEAETACPDNSVINGITYSTEKWSVPSDADWDNLARGTGGTATAGPGNAGIRLRATSGWASNSTDDTYSLFAALPVAATGITPAPTGSYAYWWTNVEGGYAVVPGSNPPVADPNYNLGNYRFIEEQSTALGKGASAKLTTRLQVRCVK